jgi:uncharacterized protein DUF1579
MSMNVFSVAACLALSAVTASLCVQGEKKRFAYPWPASQEEAMARWMKVCQPSAAHERLKELLGTYDTTTRMSMGGPGSKPIETKGTAETTWLVEGRWLQTKWSGEMMGQKTTGLWILGYDNFKERFVYTTVDSFQTCMNSASGLFDQSGDHLILWGTIDEPMTPEQDKLVKYVWRDFGKDKYTFEVHDMMIGESNTKVIEIEHVRRK